MKSNFWLAGVVCAHLLGSQTVAPENTIVAEQIATDGSWGNTEGPAIDSKGNLYFCSRGTYKGIVRWNAKEGAQRWLDVASKAGPGGLWIDAADNIYVTATDERAILKVTPDKKVTTIAQGFEKNAGVAKGPNDLVVARNGTIYFTDPNGYDGSAPNGTVYRVDRQGTTTVFNDGITGPNGIMLSADETTLYVAHNIDQTTSKIRKWTLKPDGSAGPMSELATVKPCVADGMALDREGALWLTCYSYGTAYRINTNGAVTHQITTAQKALTNAKFGRGADVRTLYLTSSDMKRVTGYIYRATVPVAGHR